MGQILVFGFYDFLLMYVSFSDGCGSFVMGVGTDIILTVDGRRSFFVRTQLLYDYFKKIASSVNQSSGRNAGRETRKRWNGRTKAAWGRLTAYSFLCDQSKFQLQNSIVLCSFTDPPTRKNKL